MQLADGRPLLLAGLFLPVLGWVAFNSVCPRACALMRQGQALTRAPPPPVGAPFFRQLDAMQGKAPAKGAAKKRAVVTGLTGLTAAALLAAPESADAAQELAQLADGRPLLLAGLFLPVLGWVAFNIGAPFFRQLGARSQINSAALKTSAWGSCVLRASSPLADACSMRRCHAGQGAREGQGPGEEARCRGWPDRPHRRGPAGCAGVG